MMSKSVEVHHLIPVAEIDTVWEQIREIPVTHTKLKIGSRKFTYLEFIPLGIKVGGFPHEPIETVQQRIRAQMIHRLETSQELLQRVDPPPGLVLEIQVISKYFTSRDNSNVPPCL